VDDICHSLEVATPAGLQLLEAKSSGAPSYDVARVLGLRGECYAALVPHALA
jgi:hypothetical protein